MIPTSPPTAAQVEEFAEALFEPDDLVEVRLLPSRLQDYVRAESLADHVLDLAKQNKAGQNVYVGANPRVRHGGSSKDVAVVRCLFVDIDHIEVGAAVDRLEESGLPWPSAVISSGHGVHAYWRLVEPLEELEKFKAAQRQLIDLLQADPSIHDLPRVMRLPGFINHKPPAARCELLCTCTDRFRLDELVKPATGRGKAAESAKPVDCEPAQVIAHWLRQALSRATKGSRNKTGLWLACQLRDAGVSEDDAAEALEQYANEQDADYTAEEAMASLRSAYGRPARDPATLRVVVGDEGDDPPILPLADSEQLPEIPPTALPEWAAQYAEAISRAKEVSPTLATLLMLPALASTCQRLFVVEMESGYFEPLCLFAAPALESGERKTAIHGPIVRPLLNFQSALRKEAKQEIKEAEIKRRIAEKQIKSLERQIADVQEMGDVRELERIKREILKLEMANPKPGGLPQLVMDDFTDAALGVALSENGESLLVTSDEGGLFDNLAGRFSELAEIDLFLKSHTGSSYTVNRTGRDNIILDRPLLSVAVSPQPGVLAKLGGKPGFADRGLLARFLWALPQSSVGSRSLVPMKIPAPVERAYEQSLATLAKQGRSGDDCDQLRIKPASEAHELWKHFQRSLELRMGPAGDLRSIKPWASKLPGAVARIAAICHVSAQTGLQAAQAPIDAERMSRALETGRLLIPHALAAHRLMLGGGRTVAAAVVEHFDQEGWPRESKSQSEWWRQVRRHVGESSKDFAPVAQVLLDHGYLIEVEHPATYRTGRPGRYYRANRRLLEGSD